VFGAKAAIQRCCRHKERNILEHLPQDERPLVQRRLRTAWATADPDQAAAELEQLAAAWPASGPAPLPACARGSPRR
jgi:putative transposase